MYEPIEEDDTVIILSSNDDNDFIELFLERRFWLTELSVDERNWGETKFLAIYRASPVQGITHYARVERIWKPSPDLTHFMLGTPIANSWIGYVKNAKVRGSKFTTIGRLLKATDYDDL